MKDNVKESMTNIIKDKDNENQKYSVYIHTNKENKKVYIGITSKSPKERWKKGEGYKEQVYFYNAIKYYGWNKFTHKVLYTGLTKEEAGRKEIELIKMFNSTNPECGYNLDSGGFDITETKRKAMKRGKIYKNEPIIVSSTINNTTLLFNNIKELCEKTGLKEDFVRRCLDDNSISLYKFEYLNKK